MFKKFTLTLALVMAFCLNASAAKVSYSASFTASAPTDWVALDNNADGVTWAYDGAYAAIAVSDGVKTESDDYYVSPALTLEAGVTYTITTVTRNYYYSGGNLTLKCGTSLTDAASYTDISALNPVAGENFTTETFTYTPSAAGEYYFAFHSNLPVGGMSFHLGSFSIEGGEDSGETVEPGEGEEGGETETPELAEGQFVVTENFDDDTHFTASTTVPDGWASAGSFPFGRAIATDYGLLANSGSYVIASARQQYDTSVDEVIYTPLKNLVAGKECTLSFYIYAPGGSPAATFYQTVTVKAGTAQTADAQTIEVGAITAAVSAWTKYEYTFTPEADGEYCFSLTIARSSALNRDHGFLLFDDFTITGYSPAEEETPAVETVALPYSIDFSTKTDGVAAWTAIDLSEEPYYTWAFEQNGYYHTDNSTTGFLGVMGLSVKNEVQNDYCVSPAFALEAGKKYKVTTKVSDFNLNFTSTWTLELGTDPADAATFTSVGSLSPQLDRVGVNDLPSRELTIEVAESGVYYLAIHASTTEIKSNSSNSLFLHYFAVEEKAEDETPDTPVATATLPYTIDFTAAANTEWTTIDNNGSLTWAYVSDAYNMGTPAVSISAGYGVSETSDDYYVSPQFTLEAGKTYVVKTRVADGFYLSGGTFNLQIGTSATDASTYSVVSALSPYDSWNYINASDVPEATYEISVSETGTYHLAYYQSVTANCGWFYQLIDFSIAEKEEDEVVIPDVETAAIPYSIDFTTSQEGWTALANDEVSSNWQYGSKVKYVSGTWYAAIDHASSKNSNDLWVSPAFLLNAGKKYKVTVRSEIRIIGDATPTLNLALGTSAEDASTFSALTSLSSFSGNMVALADIPFEEYTFTAFSTGVYYLAVQYIADSSYANPVDLYNFAIEEVEEEVVVDPLYVVGSCQGWDPSNGLEMTYADGVYTLENAEFADGGNFSLTSVKGTWDEVNANKYGFAENNAIALDGDAYTIAKINGDCAIQIPVAGVYTIVADLSAMTVTVTCTNAAYDNLYVLGNYKDSSWDPSYGVEHTKVEEGVFTGEVDLYEVHEDETGTGKAYFNLATALGTASDDWATVNASLRFAAVESNKAIATSEIQTLVPDTSGNPNSWVVDAKNECLVNMTVNLKKRTIAINSITGIENVGVDADDSEAVYYNLQGIEVVNPTKGNIYIVKRGNRVTKELK